MASYLQEISAFLLALELALSVCNYISYVAAACRHVLIRALLSDSVTPWAVAGQAPPSLGFCRQGYWRGLPCPPRGDLPTSEPEPASLMSPALAGGSFSTAPPEDTVATCETETVCGSQTLVSASVHTVEAVSAFMNSVV